MKKILILLTIALPLISCNNFGVVSERGIRDALSILDEDTTDLPKYWSPEALGLSLVRTCVHNKAYKAMECTVLDDSDVDGEKSIRACIIYNAVNRDSFPEGPNILVEAMNPSPDNKNKIKLLFYGAARKTDTGVSYSSFAPLVVLVNLKTRKMQVL